MKSACNSITSKEKVNFLSHMLTQILSKGKNLTLTFINNLGYQVTKSEENKIIHSSLLLYMAGKLFEEVIL